MKNYIIGLVVASVLLGGAFVLGARAESLSCSSGYVVQNGVCVPINGDTSLRWIIEAYCKKDQVKYSDWSVCDKRFGKNGLQWRQIELPTFNGCKPSVYDQVNTVRECLN